MFFDKEDDEQDFLNPKSSKLGALFGMDRAGSQGGNESLTYTAPKQPKKKEDTPPAKGGGPVVSHAVAVHAYKYVDNKYASVGKLGAAILSNHASSEYSILMYVTQQQKVATAKITASFPFTTQPNKYAQFYDDSRQSWSILFESEQNAADFAKHVCLAKALTSGPTPSSLVTQDLVTGDGGDLQTGDSVEVKYTGWLLTNNTFGQVFDSNVNADKLFRFKIGAGKVIKGWDSGVMGMKKGGKRFLVVPPGLAYGTQGMANRVPANSTLLFEVEVVRVKLVGRESSPSPAPTPVPSQPPPEPQGMEEEMEEEMDGQTVKGRTRSITEQIAHSPPGDTSKAKLISRMAKMGKPMLPFSGAIAANTESDDEHVPQSPKPVSESPSHEASVHRPVPRTAQQTSAPAQIQQQQQQQMPVQQQQAYPTMSQAQPQPAFLQNLPGAQQMAVFQPQSQQNYMQQQMMQQGFQPQMYGGGVSTQQQAVPGTSYPQYLVPGMPQGQGDMMLLSETRQTNTEMRLSLSKVSDKVDQVIQKIDVMNSQAGGTAMLPNMETSVLLHNITRVIQENERLKKDVFDKSGKIETLNDKISGLLEQNQSYVEKSQVLMEQRNEGLLTSSNQVQSKVLALEQEKVVLTKNLSETTSQISALQMEVTSLRKREFELSQQLEVGTKDTRKQGEELETLRTQHAEDESRIAELQRLLRDEKQGRKSVDSSLSQLQEELTDLRDTKQALEKNLSERKKKAAEERRRLEDEMNDLKTNLEADIQSLKDKLRKQKTSASTTVQEQISRIEEELHSEWQEKWDKLLAAAAKKHARALKDLREEKAEVESALQEMEKKLASARSSTSGTDQRIAELQAEVEELASWKDKYNSLRGNAAGMKERYEERIGELEAERDAVETEKVEAEKLVQKLRAELKAGGGVTGATGGGAVGDSASSLLDEVKKIMNNVYKELREVFEADESYTGTEILTVILNSIKSTTMSLVRQQKSVEEEEEEEEEESEEEDDDEEEDEEESEEEDDEQKEEDTSGKASEVLVEEPAKVTVEAKTEAVNLVSRSNSNITSESSDTEDRKDNSVNISESAKETNVEEVAMDTVVIETEQEETQAAEAKPEEKDENEKSDNADWAEEELEPVIESTTNAAPESNLKKANSLEDMLDSALDKGSKPDESHMTPLMSTEPPPLMDAESSEEEKEEQTEKDRTKSIFNDGDDDDNVADTLGFTSKPVVNGDDKKAAAAIVEEDLKPKPPPPLFGDDDDDDDLDWLS